MYNEATRQEIEEEINAELNLLQAQAEQDTLTIRDVQSTKANINYLIGMCNRIYQEHLPEIDEITIAEMITGAQIIQQV